MSGAEVSVDWARPIEAVRVVPVRVSAKREDHVNVYPHPEPGVWTFELDGSHGGSDWRIRNVQDVPEMPHTAPSAPEVDREVVAKVRDVLRAEIARQCMMGAGTFTIDDGYAQSGLWQISADLDPVVLIRAIVALIDIPPQGLDPDLAEARKLCSVEASRMGDTGLAMEYLSGDLDDQFEMKVARRALEKEAGR